MGDHDVHDELDRRAREVAADVVEWRHHLHRHPELPNREEQTAAFIVERLQELGLDEVRTGIAGHGVVGVLRGRPSDGGADRRVVALRADIDALPVPDESGVDFASEAVDHDYPGGPFPVSHACGHDCHTAMLLGAATVLAGVRDELPGDVLFVFQPAEEGPPVDEPGGARQMVAEGAFADPVPTMAFGMHVQPYPKGDVVVVAGNQFGASCLVKITITGEQVHGSTPWQGIDPMPAAGAILTGIGQVYRRTDAFDPLTVSIGHVEDVGRFNIIGRSVTLWGTVRANREAAMEAARTHLQTLVAGTAAAYGCTGEVEYLQDVPAVHNAPAWVEAARPTLARVVGEERLGRPAPTLGYDDVSELVQAFGGLYVGLGAQDTQWDDEVVLRPVEGGRGLVPNHNPRFYADDDILVTGVRLHAHVAYDHLVGTLLPTGPADVAGEVAGEV